MKNIVTIENLNLFYGDFQALKKVNMAIQEKSITAFIGPSGCGKSTLLRTLNRMNDMIVGIRIEGQVIINETNIYDSTVNVELLRKNIGMVFQQPNPFPKSIYENVAYGPRIHGISTKSELDAIVEKSLRQSALWDEVKDYLKKSAYG
ncbi:MAG: ATP-binding cassette domain-containing protein, partial [Bacilli bacterium]